jgi:L-lactate dehydrogenase complex protein LldG
MLAAIRRGLGRGALAPEAAAALDARLTAPPRHLRPGRASLPRPALIAQFLKYAEREHATVTRLADAAAVPAAVAAYLAAQNLPAAIAMPWAERPLLRVEPRRAAPDDAASLQHGFAGIAETGTLMFPSGPQRPTTLNLLPDTALVFLRASRIVGALEDAWALLRAEHRDARTAGALPRNVMLVTGPSRSADIEQTLELGAHGPRRLHILLVDDDPDAPP